ncbi:PD40 domain-containing protein [Phototrophicus methaneseepsis]|uniref:PD40 domain-containing protein n=1 Tax=Phototrophicus methaneseepsis TaxID=2710758 RepID=A0A7S8IEQ3_9CHLR|nr:PD40 domain-containing protein [Phototrophicus methaneseepsis]QPC82048.1 PD40 domain-containing protein [Phototrophicus methaneseepsis]
MFQAQPFKKEKNVKIVLAIALGICLLTGSVIRSQGLPLGQDIDGARLDWHPNDTMLAITDNQTVKIIDSTNLQTINALPAAASYITDVGWSPDGTKLAISSDFNIEIWNQPWDSANAQLERTLQAPEGVYNIISLEWHPNGDMLLGVKPSTIHIWDVSSGQLVRTFSPNPAPLLSASWSHDGNKIALGDIKGRIIVEDITTTVTKMEQVYDQDAIFSLSWKNTDEYLAAGTASSIIQLIYLDNFGGAGTIYAGVEDIVAMDWNPTNNLLATGSPDGTVAIWDMNTLQMVLKIDTDYPIPSIKWNTNGDKLAYSNGNGHVSIMQLPTGEAGNDQVLSDSDNNSTELVTLDGSDSSDPDGTIVDYSWTEDDVEIAAGIAHKR